MKTKNRKLNIDAIEKNYQYEVEYGCANYGPPIGGCTCPEHDYCRCSIYHDFEIKKIHIDRVFKEICHKDCEPILRYCTYRILVSNKLWDVSNWYADIQHSYYGEEINSIKIDSSLANKLIEKLSKLESLKESSKDMIFYALHEEYQFVLDKLDKATDFVIKTVKLIDVMPANSFYMKKISDEDLNIYSDYNEPICLCEEDSSGKYRIIDGYHRYFSAKKYNKKKVDIVVAIFDKE